MQKIWISGISLPAQRPAQPGIRLRRYAGAITLLVILTLWQLVTMLELVQPAFSLPAPAVVAERFYQVLMDGRLWHHTQVTLTEILYGLGIGVLVGMGLGYVIAKSTLLEAILSPIIVAFQSTPTIAYAPLLVIWFGSGFMSKIVICVLIVFFPMLMNTVVGIRNVPSDLHDLMRVSQATRWQTFIKLEVPAAMPVLLTGLKTSATLAVIGAVVGEFIAANAGLGFMMMLAKSVYDTPLMIVGVMTLAVIAGVLYSGVSLLQRRLLAWQRRK